MPDQGSPLDKVVTRPGVEALARELPGWAVLPLGGADRPAFAVLHPASGVALIDAAPGAVEALQRYLEAAGFARRFGALPPIAAIALGPEDAGLAGERVAAAFTELPPLAFAPDTAWVRAAREVLNDPSFHAMAAPQPAAEPGEDSPARPAGRTGGRRLLAIFWAAVGLLILAGGLLLQLAGPPSTVAEPETKPGADAPAVPLARVVPAPADEVAAPIAGTPAATETLPPAPPVAEASPPAPAVAEAKDEGRVAVADAAPEAPREQGGAAVVPAPPPAVTEAAQQEAEAANPPTASSDRARAEPPASVATASVTPPAAEASPAPADAAEEESEPPVAEAPATPQQKAAPALPASPADDHAAAEEASEAVSAPTPAADTVSGAPEPVPTAPAATAGDAVATSADVAAPSSPSGETVAEASPAPATPEAPVAVPADSAGTAAPEQAPPPAAAQEVASADTRSTVAEPAPAAASPAEAPEETEAPAEAAPAAAPPQVVASAPPVGAPAADAPRPPVVAVPDTPLVTAMIRRGHEMLANGDISGARLLFRRAASLGSGAGALALARALDPAALVRMGVVGIRGDAAEAAYWYRIAAERGHADARREDAASRGE